MKRLLYLFLMATASSFAQTNIPVRVNSSGVVLYPTNIWNANSAAILAGIGGSSSGIAEAPIDSLYYLRRNGAWSALTSNIVASLGISGGGGGAGSVTSVALTSPSWLTVGGSPITTSGTLALTGTSQTSNTFLAGPISGSSAAPTFRAIVNADLPSSLSIDSLTTTTLGAGTMNIVTQRVGELIVTNGVTIGGVRNTSWPAGGGGSSLTVGGSTTTTNLASNYFVTPTVISGTTAFNQTPPVSLTDASTISTDASLGQTFVVTLGGNRTLGAPTNPTHGQRALWVAIQDSTGGRYLTADTGAGGFQPTLTVTLPGGDFGITTNAGKASFISAIYLTNTAKWHALGVSPGL